MSAEPPLLVAFYSGGFTPSQGKRTLEPLLRLASDRGLPDSVVLDGPHDLTPPPSNFWEYSSRLVAQVDGVAGADRRVVIVAHSLGSRCAYTLAASLGKRVLCLYVVACMSPLKPVLDEVWGVPSRAEFSSLDDVTVLASCVAAWPNKLLEVYLTKPPSGWPPSIHDAVRVMRAQYGHPAISFGSKDLPEHFGASGAPTLSCPVVAVAARNELPKSETPAKMEAWREVAPADDFKLHVVSGDHFSCFRTTKIGKGASCESYDLILEDIKQRMVRVTERVLSTENSNPTIDVSAGEAAPLAVAPAPTPATESEPVVVTPAVSFDGPSLGDFAAAIERSDLAAALAHVSLDDVLTTLEADGRVALLSKLKNAGVTKLSDSCLLYTSPSPRDS